MRTFLSLSLASGLLALEMAPAALEADLITTAGTITVELDFARAPHAVANFITLAEGSRHWMVPVTGAVSNDRFYDGLTFHAIFNQAGDRRAVSGSRDGSGTDGPGFTILDDLDPALVHDPYVIALESQGPNSGGSRFYLTGVDPMPSRNGRDVVFGRIPSAASRSVVDGILSAPAGTSIVQSISFRRTDAAAEAFDPHAVALPVVMAPFAPLVVGAEGVRLAAERPPGVSILRASASQDLIQWESVLARFVGLDEPAPGFPELIETEVHPSRFYHFAQTTHPVAGGVSGFANRVLTIHTEGTGPIVYTFNATGQGGTYLNVPIPGFPLSFTGPFTVRPEIPAEYDAYRFSVLIHAEGLGGSPRNWIRGGYDQIGATQVTGRQITGFFSATMTPVFEDSGPLELTRP